MLISTVNRVLIMSLKTLCRVCACDHSEDRLLDIFKMYNQDKTIADTINELAGLKVEKDDGLPSLCCTQCQSDLLRSVDIRRKCIHSEKAIKSWLLQDAMLEPCMPEFLDPEPEDSLHDATNIGETMCLDQDESTESSSSEEAISGDHTPDTSQQNHQCCGCALYFAKENELMEHARLIHAINPPPSDSTRPFQCNICYRRAKTLRGLQIHRSTMLKQWKRTSSEAVRPTSSRLEQAETPDDTKSDSDVPEIFTFQNFQCSLCNEYFPDSGSLHEHSEKAHNEETITVISQNDCYEEIIDSCFAESMANGETEETNEFTIVTDSQDPPNDLRYRCCGCSVGFDTESELMEHSHTVHAPNAPLPLKNKPVQCNICYCWYKTKRSLRDHQLYMGNRKFSCSICGLQFGRFSALTRHNNTHNKALIYRCKQCGRSFATIYKRQIHEKTEHTTTIGTTNLNNHTCCGCGLTFGTDSELQEHSQSIHAPNAPPPVGNKPAQCSVCYRWYKSVRYVRIHQHGWRNRMLQCATCGKKFSRPSYLAAHENSHNKTLLFPCTLCDEKFPNISGRQRHVQRVHVSPPKEAETTAKHVCSLCGKSFYSEHYLKEHMNLHGDETPYKCRCGAQFKLKLYLARHMKIHSGKFTCKYCPAAFPCASLLKGHENTHTGNKEFACEICGKQFCGKGDVRKHRKKVHEKKRPLKASFRKTDMEARINKIG